MTEETAMQAIFLNSAVGCQAKHLSPADEAEGGRWMTFQGGWLSVVLRLTSDVSRRWSFSADLVGQSSAKAFNSIGDKFAHNVLWRNEI